MIIGRQSLLLFGFLACTTLHAETIHLRDQLDSVVADRIDFEPGGVRVINEVAPSEPLGPAEGEVVSPGDDSSSDSIPEVPESESMSRGRLIPWDQVRSIDGMQDPSLVAIWPEWESLSEDLWRARPHLHGAFLCPVARVHHSCCRSPPRSGPRSAPPPAPRAVPPPRSTASASATPCRRGAGIPSRGRSPRTQTAAHMQARKRPGS